MPARSFLGSAAGYFVGRFFKKFSKTIAVYAGGAFTFLTILAYNDWMSINWRKIERETINLMFSWGRKTTVFFSYFKLMFTHTIPVYGGVSWILLFN